MHWLPLTAGLGLIFFTVVIWVFRKKEKILSKIIRTVSIVFIWVMMLNFSFSPKITMALDHFITDSEYRYQEAFEMDDFTFVVSKNAEDHFRIDVYARFLWFHTRTSEQVYTAVFHLEGETEDYTVLRIAYIALKDGTMTGLIVTDDPVPAVLSVDGTLITFTSLTVPNIGSFSSGLVPGPTLEIDYDGTAMVYWGTIPFID